VFLPPAAAADCAAGVRLKSKDKRPSINTCSEQSIYPTQKSVLRTEATPDLRQRYPRTEEAVLAAGVGANLLCRLRHGRHERFSVAKLFEIAIRAGVPIVIHVKRGSRRRTKRRKQSWQ
jgi:hypothetical protein